MSKQIIFMIGLPRSGKSSWVKNNKSESDIVISKDHLRLLTYNQRFWAEGENMMKTVHSIMLRCLMEQGANIIIDDTNFCKYLRKPIIDLAKKYNYNSIKAILPVDYKNIDLCKERAVFTGQNDLISVIDNMADKFEEPDNIEFTKIEYLTR